MAPASRDRVTGLVLAAGGSTRLGQPKQLLPYGGASLLEHVLNVARRCRFAQLLCVIGGWRTDVRERVSIRWRNGGREPELGTGCSSSIAAALTAVDPRATCWCSCSATSPASRRRDGAGAARRARHGAGGRLSLRRRPRSPARLWAQHVPELADMHGDKAVWKLMESRHEHVVDVPVPGLVPHDIDTWQDYRRAVGEHV